MNFAKFLRTPFLQNTSGRTTSESYLTYLKYGKDEVRTQSNLSHISRRFDLPKSTEFEFFLCYHLSHFKGELHSNYIFLHFALIRLEWDSTTLFTKMNFFFFQNSHFNTICTRYIYGLLFINMNIF